MNVAEQIDEYLAGKGVTHAFGIVGGANLPLVSALAERLEFVAVAHEQAAAMAANYYYRVSGKLAPVIPTNGGGTMNALTGVVDAQMDGIPLLVISGNEQLRWFALPRTRTIGFQGVDPTMITASFVKQAVRPDNPLGAKLALDALYNLALEPRMGACWLDMPQDVANAVAE